MGIIIAAGALFTAVYDVIYKYNSSNTINLNATTVNKMGQTSFSVLGTKFNGVETTSLSFDAGTYLVIFSGQDGNQRGSERESVGEGAVCLAFYKGSSMTVTVGEGGGKCFDTSWGGTNGGGRTKVLTNFALPTGYSGELTAIAAGAGGGNASYSRQGPGGDHVGDYYTRYRAPLKTTDGTFAGWEGTGNVVIVNKVASAFYRGQSYIGAPATQNAGGFRGTPYGDETRSPDPISTDSALRTASGGGAGYYDGGAGWYLGDLGGGGSCTPWCYPLGTSDLENNIRDREQGSMNGLGCDWGATWFYQIDPTVMPSSGDPVEYGETVRLVEGGVGAYTPVSAVQDFHSYTRNSDVGIRAGWVYSVSEDGKSWQGVGPETLRV